MAIIFDVETRSEIDLKRVGAWIYSKHHTTKVLCLAYKIDGGETKVIDFREESSIPSDFRQALDGGSRLLAFNTSFEQAIYLNILSERHNWPPVHFSRFLCIQAHAAQFSLPRSLEGVSDALGLKDGKDKEGHRIMLQLCKPKKPSKKDPSLWYDDDERYSKLLSYCKKDVDVTYNIRNKLMQLTNEKNYFIRQFTQFPSKELRIFTLNSEINLRGVKCDISSAEHALVLINKHSEILTKELEEITDGEITSIGQVAKIVEMFHKKGIHIPDLKKENVELWLGRTKGKYKRILEIRQQLGKSSIKKIKAMLERSDDAGRIRDLILYYGASRTGRFSGKGIQVQNLIRPCLTEDEIAEAIDMLKERVDYLQFIRRFPNLLDAISSCLRGFLIPDKGHVFFDSDFSAIEARVIFWLANEEIGLEMYRQGIDIYKDMASNIYGKAVTFVTKLDRQLGKQAILGCSYGLGKVKFRATCQGHGMDVSEELADTAIKSYRKKFSKVVDFWYRVEKCASISILNPGRRINCGKVSFYTHREYLYICLPSGRALAYHSPRVQHLYGNKFEITYKGYSSQVKKFEEQRTWGGKLVENITQAVARDFMTEAMLRVDEKGYPIVFTVHDQVICEVDELSGNSEEFTKLMEIVPKWGEGCPIIAETQVTKRFKK